MKFVMTLFAILLVFILAGVGFAYSGLYNVSAQSTHSGLAQWFLSTTSHASIKRQASDIEVPELDGLAIIQAGVNDYESMCAGCHGAPGQSPEAVGLGLNPPAPDLSESATRLSPAELFWVTKNGIKMTGMPAWGETHEDDAIWPVVAFTTQLRDLDAVGYQALLADAAGAGHHAEGQAHDDDNESGMPMEHSEETLEHPSDENDQDEHSHGEPATPEPEEKHSDGHDHEH